MIFRDSRVEFYDFHDLGVYQLIFQDVHNFRYYHKKLYDFHDFHDSGIEF